MSYYRPSFSQMVAMSRGSGRGYTSRGSSSYGSSGRGSSWSDRGRGSFSSNRGGRFSSYSGNTNTFDSRSRYQSSSSSANDRYSSSRGRDDSSYRRSYRSDGPNSYSSARDSSSHRSPERKRMRLEASSSRRSHEGGYGGGDSYNSGAGASRYESTQAGNNERRSFNDDRRAFKARDDYRKPASMSGPGGSIRSSPRGGYRGRVISRGARGSRISMRDPMMRRRLIDSGSYVRKRGAALRPTDFLRRKMVSRLRSAATRHSAKKRDKSSEKEDSDKEENWDDDNDVDKKPDDDKPDDEKTPPAKKSQERKDKDESDKEDKKSTVSEDERPRSKITGRPFIRLTCLHCGMKCVTFKEYSMHLYSGRHTSVMRKIAIRQKGVVARMRLAQRNAQREIEKSSDSLSPRTNFCPICKLNYRQLKATHQMSEAHRSMKKFLMPYCHVCVMTFKSPMLYENHMCSLDHIKRKAHHDLVNGEKNGSDKEPSSPPEEDMENFMTLDSVGDVDEEDDEAGSKLPKSPVEAEDGDPKQKEAINVGAEHIKKIEVMYCNLCRIYLARNEDPDKVLRDHCRGRKHLTRYVRFKEDKDLRRQAERIHRKSQEAKEAKEKEKEKDDKPKKEESAESKNIKVEDEAANEEDAIDDKIWADVDKDLGEILAEVNAETGNKSSDEDEDSRPAGERYDRFRYSEKGGEEKAEQKPVIDEKDQEEIKDICNEEVKIKQEKIDEAAVDK